LGVKQVIAEGWRLEVVGWSFELGFGFNWRLEIRLEVGDPRAWGPGWRLGAGDC
jgi:hypothetical protein